MRYLISVTLAVVLLMALACTAAPAAPTPNIDATVEARALVSPRDVDGLTGAARQEICLELI